MYKLSYIFITMLIFTAALSGQTQYTSVPRTGEGRFDRSENTTFWANPIFFKPAVFFSSSDMNVRANRKWWRNEKRLLPEPYIFHGYLPKDSTLKAKLAVVDLGTANNPMMGRPSKSFPEIGPLFFPLNIGKKLRSALTKSRSPYE